MTAPIARLELNDLLRGLPHWTAADGEVDAIVRHLRFRDFPTAMAFMARVAFEAQRRDHHPEWRNVYDRVDIVLTTHDAGGVSERDAGLAHFIDALVSGPAAGFPLSS